MRVTDRECEAMRLLAKDGWTVGELKMTMLCSRESVKKHVCGDCAHTSLYALPDYDGRTAANATTNDSVGGRA